MNVQIRKSLLCVAAITTATSLAQAQSTASQAKRLEQYVQAVGKIPANQQQHLSGGAINLLTYAQHVTQPPKSGALPDGGVTGNVSARGASALANVRAGIRTNISAVPLPAGVASVSNSKQDFTLSVLGGFTQSETTTAWCGNTVVVGYNDSGSYLRTAGIDPQGSASFNGVATSFNEGASFKALDYLNPGPNPVGFLGGDPVVVCSSPSTFYYSSLFSTADAQFNPLSAISVSASGSGGVSWGAPGVAIAKDGFTHTLDKDWLAIDPKKPGSLYVTYTDFDFSGTSAGCPNDSRTAIELVASFDGGNTWGAPAVVVEECGASGNFVQGSQVAVSRTADVFVSYEFFAADGSRSIKLRGAGTKVNNFGPTIEVTPVTQTGDGGALQGEFRTNEFPSMAIDPINSDIYIAWGDGRNNVVPDLASFSGTYGYGDVFVTKSISGGRSWTAPVAISPTPPSYAGIGRDQFMPGIAIDRSGNVGVCYYDRRLDPENEAVDRFCSVSHDRGGSWTDSRKTLYSWIPVHGSDVYINPAYMGDYDETASDQTGANSGFIGAFQIQTKGNPDVFAAKF